jgi:hypothetical protein
MTSKIDFMPNSHRMYIPSSSAGCRRLKKPHEDVLALGDQSVYDSAHLGGLAFALLAAASGL